MGNPQTSRVTKGVQQPSINET